MTNPAQPHPIHLHGHDFLVLGSSDSGTFNLATDQAKLNFVNPMRRDVAMLPAGWLVIAFQVRFLSLMKRGRLR
jgi:FtsP/CotA-like multicopper oxidase with cupredoxin domain